MPATIGLVVPEQEDLVDLRIEALEFYEHLREYDKVSFEREVGILVTEYQNPARSGPTRIHCFGLLKRLGIDVSSFSWSMMAR